MENFEPIIIVGYGRSGTTWLSDIVSKTLGGVILFEPLFPYSGNEFSKWCYYKGDDENLNNELIEYLDDCLSKKVRDKWLLRNHVASDLSNISKEFTDSIWTNCRVIGSKFIRANFMLPLIHSNLSTKIVGIRREVYAVVSSIMRRPRFWSGDYGYEAHLQLFEDQVLRKGYGVLFDPIGLTSIFRSIQSPEEKIAAMWKTTDLILKYESERLDFKMVEYEDLYLDPYNVAKSLLSELMPGVEINLHPSYLFTPSMVTHRTNHEFNERKEMLEKYGMSFFWKDFITDEVKERIDNTIVQVESIFKGQS